MARRRRSQRSQSRSTRKRLIWAPFNNPARNVLTIDNVNVVSAPVLLTFVSPAQLGNFAEYTVMATNFMTGALMAQADDGNAVSVWIGATLLDPETVAAEVATPGSQSLPGFFQDVGGPNEQVSVEPWFWLNHFWATSIGDTVAAPDLAPGINTRTEFFPGKSKRVVEQGDQVAIIAQAGQPNATTLDSVINVWVDGRILLQYSP